MFFDAPWILQIIVLIIVMAALYFLINDFLIDKGLIREYKEVKKMLDEYPDDPLLKKVLQAYEEIIKKYNIK